MEGEKANQPKQENLLLNLAFNLLIPILLLNKGTDWIGLDAKINLVIALTFPIAYGIHFGIAHKKLNFLSVLGFVSIFVKGSIGLFELKKEWVAINEAALPLIFGFAVLATVKMKKPLVKLFLFNEQVFDVHKVEEELDRRGTRKDFDKLLIRCTVWLAFSFLISAVLNFVVAEAFIKTEPSVDLEQFNKELGAMQGWSYLIITVPTMVVTFYALWILLRGLKQLTGLGFEDVIHQPPEKEKKD